MNWFDEIRNYKCFNEQEIRDKEVMIKCYEAFDDILKRENEVVHMTSTAVVLNKKRDKVIMIHHNIFNSWSLPGGHADGESNLIKVAVKEAEEETGIRDITLIRDEIIALDSLTVFSHERRGEYVPAHLHLSVVYLFEGDEEQKLTVKEDENSGVRWIPIDKMVEASTEPHMQKIYRKIIKRVKEMGIVE